MCSLCLPLSTCLPGPLTYFNRQSIQSTVALANTNILSVLRKTSNTSNTAATCLCRTSLISSSGLCSILTALKAPNNGLQPDFKSAVQASTNSQTEHTTYKINTTLSHSYPISMPSFSEWYLHMPYPIRGLILIFIFFILRHENTLIYLECIFCFYAIFLVFKEH